MRHGRNFFYLILIYLLSGLMTGPAQGQDEEACAWSSCMEFPHGVPAHGVPPSGGTARQQNRLSKKL
ncbi:MAG: hypothetical protein IPG76_08105 [Acidobacteria bacterium]|nr:hypothetical protein [Acidobacteriota bacterium]